MHSAVGSSRSVWAPWQRPARLASVSTRDLGARSRSVARGHGRHCGRQMPTNPRRSSVQHRRPAGHGWPARSVAQRVPFSSTADGAAGAADAVVLGAADADALGARDAVALGAADGDAPGGAPNVAGDADWPSGTASGAAALGVVGEWALGWLGGGAAGPQPASANRSEVGTRVRMTASRPHHSSAADHRVGGRWAAGAAPSP